MELELQVFVSRQSNDRLSYRKPTLMPVLELQVFVSRHSNGRLSYRKPTLMPVLSIKRYPS